MLWSMCAVVPCAGTLAVSVMSHLDLQTSQTSIPVQLTVISVGLTVAATNGPLVGFAALVKKKV